MDQKELQNIVRAIIQASPKPVTLESLCEVFVECEEVQLFDIKDAITAQTSSVKIKPSNR